MRILIFIFLIFSQLISYGQVTNEEYKLMIVFMDNNQPLAGASINVKGHDGQAIALTDINGTAEIDMVMENEIIEFSILGPYIAVKVHYPVDSIRIDLNSKRATYYHDGRRIKKRKIVIKGY